MDEGAFPAHNFVAGDIVAHRRLDRYTPEMVATLREAFIHNQVMAMRAAQGLSPLQARIIVIQQLESWENRAFETSAAEEATEM